MFRVILALATFLMIVLVATLPARAIETAAAHALLIDSKTGRVLIDKESDVAMAPASMSKLMTVFMVLERLKNGSLTMDDSFPVSEKAWRMGGSKMFVGVNTRIKISDLLRGIAVQSGNDACIVVAEGLASSESAFADEMTTRARELGLTNSTFRNSTGWPDPEHLMTTRDLATLARHLILDFPEYYPIFSEKSFTYNKIRQGNRNPLLYRYEGADGLKTGHTEASGYGLVASAAKKGRRLILVVNGLGSVKQRAQEAERLLDWGFREYNNYDLFKSGEQVMDVGVWLGRAPAVSLVIENDLTLTLARKARRKMKVRVDIIEPVPAPISKGQRLGALVISGIDMPDIHIPLLAAADVPRLGMFGRLGAAFKFLAWGAGG